MRLRKDGKAKSGKKSNNSLRKNAYLCMLGGLLSMALFSFTTFAWLNDSVSSPGSTLAAANYAMEIRVNDVAVEFDENDFFVYTVDQAGDYTVKLTASGNATTGYAIVKIGDENYFSEQMAPGEEIFFTMAFSETTTVTLGFRWGRHGKTEGTIGDGARVSVSDDVTVVYENPNSENS